MQSRVQATSKAGLASADEPDTLVTFATGGRVPAHWDSRRCHLAGCVVALALLVSGCSLGGGDDGAEDTGQETGAADTGPDVEALRAAWAEPVSAACSERDAQSETLAQGLPKVVEQEGWAAAAEQFAPVDDAMLETMSEAEPAPGDEAQAEEMADLYQEAGELRIQALRAKYLKRDRQFYALMNESEDAREEANSIATELGAADCAVEPAGPYATVEGLAAVRWGDRASSLCRERDRAYMSLRPTDTSGFDAVTRRWLRQTRALEEPEQYARRIDRFLDQYEESARALDKGLTEKSNQLISKSTELMYQLGFELGFDNFCSAKPA
jgi:hypothetical protein